jgi:hypothetical protein
VKNRVAVEKLLPTKSAKMKLRQGALQSIFSGRSDIFYPPNFGYFGTGKRVFQQPLAIALTTESDTQLVAGYSNFAEALRF